jgi:DNA polymerase-3 subunit epsilon
MKLERPIVYFDIESTGVETETARIVELACIKYNIDGTKEEKTILVNPGVPIPIEASDVHGITDEIVKDKPFFKQYAQAIRNWFDGCDLAGFNSDNFDIPLLSAEFERSGLEGINWNPNLLDIMKLYRLLYPNTLSDVYKRLTGKELEGAHGALVDIIGTKEIADILIPKLKEATEETLETVSDIDSFMQGDKKRFDLAGKMYVDTDGVVKWNFSKNKDKAVLADAGFVLWFIGQNSFPKESKDKLKELQKIKKEHE